MTPFGLAGASGGMVGRCMPKYGHGGTPGTPFITIFGIYVCIFAFAFASLIRSESYRMLQKEKFRSFDHLHEGSMHKRIYKWPSSRAKRHRRGFLKNILANKFARSCDVRLVFVAFSHPPARSLIVSSQPEPQRNGKPGCALVFVAPALAFRDFPKPPAAYLFSRSHWSV